MFRVMKISSKRCCVTRAFIVLIFYYAVAVSQEMDQMESTEPFSAGQQPKYLSTISNAHENSQYSNNEREHINTPTNLKNFVLPYVRTKGPPLTSDSFMYNISFLSFIHQYYRSNVDKTFLRRQSNFNPDLKFRKRKLLSTSQSERNRIKSQSWRSLKMRRTDHEVQHKQFSESVVGNSLKNSDKNEEKKIKRDDGKNVKKKESEMQHKQFSGSVTVNSSNVSNSSKNNLEKLALQELEEYEEFVALMQQTFSKDPLRAMLSLAFLMTLLMVAIKLCGMKPTNRHQEIHTDYQDEVHYMSIHDILKRKRPYLPKYLLSWERRLRRKFKRRQKMKKASDQEPVMAPVSDNSEEECLIYGGNLDF